MLAKHIAYREYIQLSRVVKIADDYVPFPTPKSVYGTS